MKIASWKRWLCTLLPHLKWSRQATSVLRGGCVALGLATAWGSDAQADMTFRTEITPAHDLLDGFVYYGNNGTGAAVIPLGSLTAGATYTFIHHFTTLPNAARDWDDPSLYEPNIRVPVGFFVGGIYQRDEGIGTTVSFPDSTPLATQESWDEFFDYTWYGPPPTSEQGVVDLYFEAMAWSPSDPPWYATPADRFWGLTNNVSEYTQLHNHYGAPDDYREKTYLTPYGQQSTLISFRETRFAGTAIVSIIPEPSSAILLLVTMSGVIAVARWRR